MAHGAGLAAVRAQLTLVHVCQRDQATRQGLAGTRPHIPATTPTLQRSPASRRGCRGPHIGNDDIIPLTDGHSETYSVRTGTQGGAQDEPLPSRETGTGTVQRCSQATGLGASKDGAARPECLHCRRLTWPQQVTAHPPPLPSTHTLQSAGLCPTPAPATAAAGTSGSFPR